MRLIFSASALAFATTWVAAAEPARVTLDVPSMNCALCPVTVSKALRRLPGVVDAQGDLATKSVEVTYDASRIAPAQLERAVTQAGYPAKAKAR